MSLVPEQLFNKRVGIETNEGILKSGALWYEDYSYSAAGGNDGYIAITKIFTMEPDELSDLNDTISTHYDPATGIKKRLFSLGGGIYFCVSVYVIHDDYTGVNSVVVSGGLEYNGTYYFTNIPGLSSAGGVSVSDGTLYDPVSLVKTYGIKFTTFTNYSFGQGKAIMDVTQAAYFDVAAYIPGINTAHSDGVQSWQHINDNSLYFSSRMNDPDMSDWIYNPQYIYYGYTDNMATTEGNVFRVDNLNTFYTALKGINPAIKNPFITVDPDDPSQEEDPSGPGGGGGNMDPSSDPIPFPDLPVGGALASGAIKAFEVSPTAMTQMFLKLWDSSIFDISTFQKLVESPLDSLIQLQAVPIDPHNAGTAHIMLGNFDTEAVAPVIDQEYYTIDCGTLNVQEFWGSALDYNPYTEATLWVPMVGFRDVDVNDIMGKTIHLKYNYSIFDGNLTAQLMCGNAVLYKWPGNVMETIPVTQRVNEKMKAIASGAASILGGAVGGGGAGLAAGAISAAINVAFAQTHVSRSGTMEGSTGLLDDFMPYLIIKRPIQSLAAGFKTQKGYPSNMSAVLNTCSGYTEVEYIHLTGITGATDTELEEIESLLKEGVII